MKKRMNKRAISEMISYVILIAMAVGLSIGVFIWLKDVVNISPKIDCKDGTSLRLDDVTCTSSIINVTVKNNGNFNVTGFIIQASENVNIIPTIKLSAIGESYPPGYYELSPPLKPGDKREISFAKEEWLIQVIQIQPYIKDEKGKMIVCEQAVIKQSICSSSLISFNPLSISGVMSWWSFNGDAYDEKGVNTGTPQGGVSLTTGRDGTANGAYLFDGIDDYINANFALPASFSVEAWFNTSSTSGGIKRILLRGITTGDGETFLVDINSSSGAIRAGIRNTTGGWNLVNSPGPYNDGKFHFVIFTYNDSTKNITLYIDGVLNRSLLFVGTVNDDNQNFRIGSANPVTENFTGVIDDVMIFNRTLTPDEIKDLYGKPYEVPPLPVCPDGSCTGGETFATCPSDCGLDTIPGLVSLWKFDETDGGLTLDSKNSNIGNIFGNTRLLMRFDDGAGNPKDNSSYKNNGINNGATWTTSGCQSDKCLSFNGVNSYVNIVDSSSLRFTSNSDVSIELWAKLNNDPGWIIHNYDAGLKYWQIELRGDLSVPPRTIWSQWRTATGTYLTATGKIDLTGIVKWHHIAVVYNSSAKKSSIYIDGVFDDANINTSLSGNFYNTNNIVIGGLTTSNEYVTGLIDEVAIYSKALSPAEILEHNNTGRAKFTDWTNDAQRGSVLSFDGVDDYINISSSGSLNPFTVSMWIKRNNNGAWHGCFGQGNSTSRKIWYGGMNGKTNMTYFLELTEYDGKLPLSNGVWHHVAFSYENPGRLIGYIDGAVDLNITSTKTIQADRTYIGAGADNVPANYFNGSIDEVAIFNRVLTPEEILAISQNT